MEVKKYDSYKDSGISWLGEIPINWTKLSVRRITEDHKQGYYSSDGYIDDGYKLVRITDLDANGNIDVSSSPSVSPTDKELTIFQIKQGDILFPRTGSIGLVGVAKEDMKAVFASYLIRFRFIKSTDNSFMRYFFTSEAFLNGLFSDLHGGVNQNIHAENIKDQYLGLPTLEEQTQIAKYLDQKTTQIDTLISNKEKLIELLKEERTAIINQAVTKGLDQNIPMKDSGIEWLGEIPEHWELTRLKYVSTSIKTGSTPPTDQKEYFENGTIDWFGPGDFRNTVLNDSKKKITPLAFDEGKVKLYEANSVLLVGIGATVGKVGICESVCSSNQQINAITIEEEKYNPWLLVHYLKSINEFIVAEADSSTLPIFNQTDTKNIPICLMSLEEQNEIVEFIQNHSNRIKTLIDKYNEEVNLLKEYKTALISELVTGKVDVRGDKLN